MSWSRFSRLNQAIEDLSPTASIVQVKRAWDLFDDKEALVSLLTLEYPLNNLLQKKEVKLVKKFYE